MSEAVTAPSADLWRLLARAIEAPTPGQTALYEALALDAPADLDDLRAAHTEAFVAQCPPYASVYVGETGEIGGEAAGRVGDFRRVLGAQVDEQAPDHLPALLADYAELVAMAARDPQAAHARRALFWEHLAPWAGPFADTLARSAHAPFNGWADLLTQMLQVEAAALGAPANQALCLRAAPAWQAPARLDSHAVAARALLAPITTGVVITRADLAAAARALGVALPVGSRAFLLAGLFDSDAPGARAWLAGLAANQADARARDCDALAHISAFWARRARATSRRIETRRTTSVTASARGRRWPAAEGSAGLPHAERA